MLTGTQKKTVQHWKGARDAQRDMAGIVDKFFEITDSNKIRLLYRLGAILDRET